ncbi:MAG: type II toxin-antitoxin system VapC family toxin [Candidatus Woesearchaeota archaeon]
MYFLDTDFVINFFRGKHKTVMQELIKDRIFTGSINLYELTKGCYQSKNYIKNKSLLDEFMKNIEIVPFGESTSKIAAKLHNNLKNSGSMINENDILIAASCIDVNCILVTDNKKHFSTIKSLKLLDL